jgi:Tol biopolymer transport system component
VALNEAAETPALSPDGRLVAFAVGGRLAVVGIDGAGLRLLTPGTEWRDQSPAWRPDGQALVVATRRLQDADRDLHEIPLGPGAFANRRTLVETPYLDESDPLLSSDGRSLVFVREDSLFQMDTAEGRVRRLSGGFRKARSPRFLPGGRVLFLWTEGKEYGIDVIEADGKTRITLQRGSTFYRSVVPSPDGRFLAATFTFDLSFHLWDTMRFSQKEELRLLDLRGERVADLAASWRYANHTADWR